MNLTSNNDTYYLQIELRGSTDPYDWNSFVSLKGSTVDALDGYDTLVVYDNYPSKYFKLTTSASGVVTMSTASGKVTLQNFESIEFLNTTLTIGNSNPATSGNDTLEGTSDADDMNGLAGNDSLSGLGGNDVLDGGSGNDTLNGGAGNDTYLVDSVHDLIVEAADGGTDLVQVGLASGTYVMAANLENGIITGSANAGLTGNALVNQLTGNSGNNRLDGGAGIDKLAGGSGDDTYVVDDFKDKITEGTEAGNDTVEVNIATAGGTWVLKNNLENATLINSVDFNLKGNKVANVLTGNDADNLIDGSSGDDTLAGRDGDDTYVVDSLGDVVTELAAEGTDTVQLTVKTKGASYVLADNVENAIISKGGVTSLSGNALDNRLTGSSAANTLDGGAGNDLLAGGKGNDSFVFSTALDGEGNVDTILDFGKGDRICLDDAIFSALGVSGSAAGTAINADSLLFGTAATSETDRLIYDQSSGKLYYDATGSLNGATDQVQIALIGVDSHAALTAAMIFVV